MTVENSTSLFVLTPKNAAPENLWIIESKSGDLDAFNRIVLKYQDALFRIANRFVGPDAADDAVQDTFVSAYYRIDSYRGGSLKAWLTRILVNKCYDQIRIEKRRKPALSIDEDESFCDMLNSRFQEPPALPEEQVEARLLKERIEGQLNSMPVELRSIIQLIDMEEFSYVEAAKILGVPVGTVKSRLARARLRFREMYLEKDRLK